MKRLVHSYVIIVLRHASLYRVLIANLHGIVQVSLKTKTVILLLQVSESTTMKGFTSKDYKEGTDSVDMVNTITDR